MKLTNLQSVLFILVFTALSTGEAQTSISSYQLCKIAEVCYYHNINITSTHPSVPANPVAILPEIHVCPADLRSCIEGNDTVTVVDEMSVSNYSISDVCAVFWRCQTSPSVPATLTWDLHATWMCPNTEFCGTSSNIKEANWGSCCTPCSCSPDCGKHYECCFTSDDKFNIIETEKMECFSVETSVGTLSLYMISTCPNGAQCLKPEESTRPVSSSGKKRIYATGKCAICNLAFDYHKWNLLTMCEASRVDLYEIPEVLYQGDIDCRSALQLPSSDMIWIKRFVCDEVQTCDESFQNAAVIEACRVTRAPFLFRDMGNKVTVYRNVQCATCNMVTISRLTGWKQGCGFDRFNLYWYYLEHDAILDTDLIYVFLQSSSGTADTHHDACKQGDIVIHREQKECLSVLCAHGMLLDVDSQCQYFVLTLHDTSFQLHLKLVPTATVSTSALMDIAADQPVDAWLQHSCPLMTQEGAAVHILPTEQNGQDILEELFVTITQTRADVIQLDSLIKDARSCLEGNWRANLGFGWFGFKTELASHKLHVNNATENPTNRLTVVDIVDLDDYLPPRFVLTKLYFCDQVELTLEDIVVLDDEIRMIHNNKTLGNNEYDMINSTDDSDSFRFRVCSDDFTSNTGNIILDWETTAINTPDANAVQRLPSSADKVLFDGLFGILCLNVCAIVIHLTSFRTKLV